MNRFFFVFLLIILLSQASCTKDDYEGVGRSVVLTGTVTNTETGKPIPNVVISDGYFTTLTTENGVYFLKNHPNARHIFYSIPEEYEVPLKQGSPYFYSEIDSRYDTCVVDFKLTPLKNGIENEFTLFCVADPQVKTQKNIKRLQNETIVDIKNEAKKYSINYGITLGDLVFDSPELFPDLKNSLIDSEIPFFHTIGNHDLSGGSSSSLSALANYEYHFGPVDYSFNRGRAHIVILNNVSYHGALKKEQIAWLRSDLKHVPKNKLLIICVHIPIQKDKLVNKDEFIEILSWFPEVHIMSGHFHLNKNILYETHNIYEHITGAACGTWWNGTINKCGTPNGYAVYHIKGNTITNWYYKSTRFDSNYQIKMYAPYTLFNTEDYVIANVWNADPTWKIELYEDNTNKGRMEQYTDYDPGAYALFNSLSISTSTNWYRKTDHLFKLKPDNPSASFSVKATDRFGNIYYQSNSIKTINQLKSY